MVGKRPLAYRVVVTATFDRMVQDMVRAPIWFGSGEKEGALNFHGRSA
jgi:hypothetical protein